MQLKIFFIGLTVFISAQSFGQEIKTKVQESGFDVKPDPQKEEQFEEARLFLFAGAGLGMRQGEILAGMLASDNQPNPTYHRGTADAEPFRNGFTLDFGLRYFLKEKTAGFLPPNFGLGLRAGYFRNDSDFLEDGSFSPTKNSSAETTIYSLLGEFSYRVYLTSNKTGFAYAGVGLGSSMISQDQTYTANSTNRTYSVDEAFFAARPMLGIQLPVLDLVHLYFEAAYSFSQGKITDGTLSLSQIQLGAGVQIRLNAF